MKTFLILLLVTASALASPPEPRPTPQQLQRDPASTGLEGAEVTISSETQVDGGRKTSVRIRLPRGTTELNGRYSYEFKDGTYKIIELERWNVVKAVPLPTPTMTPTPIDKRGDLDLPEDWPPPDDDCCDGNSCSGSVSLTVRAFVDRLIGVDPTITKTTASGGWSRGHSLVGHSCPWRSTGGGVFCALVNEFATWSYNGANPCGRAGPSVSPGVWYIYGQGNYKSLNFANPSLWTYTTDWAMPGISYGYVDLDWDHYGSGDTAAALYGEFEVTLSNTCTS